MFPGQGGGLANSFEFVCWVERKREGIHGLVTLPLCWGGVVCMHVLRNWPSGQHDP